MPSDNPSSAGLRSILLMLATAGMIAFNALAATGYINNVTPKQISDRYPTVLTPAGYAFSIWSLIYFGLAVFSILQVLPKNRERFAHLRTPYIVTCVLNCGWVFFWHHDHPVVCLLLIALLAMGLVYLISEMRSVDAAVERVAKLTLGLYAGWVTVAALVNLFVVIGAYGIFASPTAAAVSGVIVMIAASLFSLFVAFRFKNYLYPLAVAWALTAIAVNQSGNTAIVVAGAVGVIIALLASLSFIIYLPLINTTRGGSE